MHGVKRDRSQHSAEIIEQRKTKEAHKIQLYKSIEEQFFTLKEAGIVSLQALEVTGQLLRFNPELYTGWNYRREILSSLFNVDSEANSKIEASKHSDFFASLRSEAPIPSEVNQESSLANSRDFKKQALLEHDLDLTIEVLKIHPKVYWIWNHRKWCLQQPPSEDKEGIAKWSVEIKMVNKMLEMDPRNFHGWNYRRFVLTHLARLQTISCDNLPDFPQSLAASIPQDLKKHQLDLAEKELKYTLSKIESNFSNFSAWHHRSLLLQPVWSAKGLDEVQRRKERDNEFEMIRQAIFVDPEDQSVWTYHSWLLGLDPAIDVLQREIASLRELLELEPDSKWCLISMADYLAILSKSDEFEEEEKADLDSEAKSLLQKLIEIDPDRAERYKESMKVAIVG